MNTEAPALTEPFEIVKVTDTRTWEEVDDDKWAAIAGSGIANDCDRCGRTHEIHAHVLDANGRDGIVGVGCMNADKATVRRTNNRATSAARKAAKTAVGEAARAEMARLEAIAEALPFPVDMVERGPWVVRPKDGDSYTVDGCEQWTIGGGWVLVDATADPVERMRSLESSWRQRQLVELAGGAEAFRALDRRTYYR